MKPVDVITATDIARPRKVVAAYAADPDHVADWYANIERVTWQTERPLTIGTRLAFVAHFLCRTHLWTGASPNIKPRRSRIDPEGDGAAVDRTRPHRGRAAERRP